MHGFYCLMHFVVPAFHFDSASVFGIFLFQCSLFFTILLFQYFLLFLSVFFDTNIMAQSSFKQYLRSLRWTPLPVGVGLALIAFQQYRHTRKREAARLGQVDPCDCLADEWEVEAYKLLPLRQFSKAWGWVNGKGCMT